MPDRRISYSLDQEGRFIIQDYNWAKPFSNFFPGIAGPWGIPLWVYYVNRGQVISSVGVRDKDHQILEFHSFNRACQLVPQEGFRTFLSLEGARVEPFLRQEDPAIKQELLISPGELVLREEDPERGLKVSVTYFPLVNLPIAGLVRQLCIQNSGSKARQIELLDGLPRVLPYGMNQQHIKHIPRHIEAMMGVELQGGVPLFRLKQTAADQERIDRLREANFYLSLREGKLCPDLFVDPEAIFGDPFAHHAPWVFWLEGLKGVQERPLLLENFTPCAFTGLRATLPPGETITLRSVLGSVRKEEHLSDFLRLAARPGFLEEKRLENRDLLERITSTAFTAGSQHRFDAYCGHNFLDNVMRGGMPHVFRGEKKKTTFYLYCRQNGDLERDYHFFVLEPGYLSQGTGHYRSIYQNRRTDAWFFPEVGDENIRWFMSLIQTDGYNPLEVLGLTYQVRERGEAERLIKKSIKDKVLAERVLAMLERPFTPGELAMALEEGQGLAARECEPLLGELLSLCEEGEIGGLHEGFWVDHWFYNLDTIDVYLMVFPDRLRQLLLENRRYTFFDNPDIVLPRSEKTILREDGEVRRYGAVVRSPEKLARIKARAGRAYQVRTRFGEGEPYQTCLLVKLLLLVATRIATLDPEGVGVEMEADKPGWNDSMNGLPGLFGSSLCETLELVKACRFLSQSLSALGDVTVPVYEELAAFLERLSPALDRFCRATDKAKAFAYWEESNTAKEEYREATRLGVSGQEREMTAAELRGFLDRCLGLLEPLFEGEARRRIKDERGVPYTYFANEVRGYEPTGKKSHQGYPLVRPKEFGQRPVPLFLEGPVHYMKVQPKQAGEVYEAVRQSPLFDAKLAMYKSCENMEGETFELGRAVGAYPRGWLENESIYLHMEYKYLLEILRSGLFDAFYRDAKTALIPFLDPAVYGRSTLEGASFIVSSAYNDPSLHGRGFQPRLSGITCEMLHMWILMVGGPAPFFLGSRGELRLRLRPALAAWLFSTQAQTRAYFDEQRGRLDLALPEDTFAFKFLGTTLVIYRNDQRKNTYGPDGAFPSRYLLTFRDGTTREVIGESLGPDLAEAVRQRKVERIEVDLKAGEETHTKPGGRT